MDIEEIVNMDDNKEVKKETVKKKDSDSVTDITKDLINQLKDVPNDLLMSFSVNNLKPPPKKVKPKKSNKSVMDHIKNFEFKPKEIKRHLDRYIVGQNEAKKALSIAVSDHYNVIKEVLESRSTGHYTKQNILMIGPTGVGKTYMIKRIAELIGVPFVKSDATKFTETGYQGGDVEDLVRQLYKKANDDVKLAEVGIIYLDEVDKITGAMSSQVKDVSGRGVQTNLLKLMEDTEVAIRAPWDIQSQIKSMMNQNSDNDEQQMINTKHILFIVSGAFNSIDEIILKRLQGATIGFERSDKAIDQHNLSQVTSNLLTQDLIKFGLEPEFAGRLPVRVAFNPLDVDDLTTILTKSKDSILDQYRNSFNRYGIEIWFSEDALKEIAEQSYKEKIGARALSSTLEKVFRGFKFECPSSDVYFIFVDKELIKSPDQQLLYYLKDSQKRLLDDINKTINWEKRRLNIKKAVNKKPIIDECLNIFSRGNIIDIVKTAISQYK